MKGEYSTSLYTCTWVCFVNATHGQRGLNLQLWVYFQLSENRGYTFFGYTLSSWLYLDLVILFYWLYLPKKVQPIFKSIAKKRKYNKKKPLTKFQNHHRQDDFLFFVCKLHFLRGWVLFLSKKFHIKAGSHKPSVRQAFSMR